MIIAATIPPAVDVLTKDVVTVVKFEDPGSSSPNIHQDGPLVVLAPVKLSPEITDREVPGL